MIMLLSENRCPPHSNGMGPNLPGSWGPSEPSYQLLTTIIHVHVTEFSQSNSLTFPRLFTFTLLSKHKRNNTFALALP